MASARRIGDHYGPESSTEGPDRLIAALAGLQHGIVAGRQLRERGVGDGAIKLRVRNHRLRPVHRGVYATGHGRLSLGPLAAGSLSSVPPA